MGPSSGASVKKGTSLGGLLVLLVAVGCLRQAVQTGVIEAQEQALQVQCADRLHQIGAASQLFASENLQRWPDIYIRGGTRWDDVGNTRSDEWDPAASTGDPPKAEPGDNGKPIYSNTANFWPLITVMGMTPDIFICPSTDHHADSLVVNYNAVRDFRGEMFVSYSYQNVLGLYRLKSTSGRALSMAVAADANPMRRDFRTSGIGDKKREGVTDEYLADKTQFIGEEEYIAAWNKEAGSVAGAWELNSPNHGFKGQNVLYLDGHVAWATHPYCGPNWDNIWLARKPEDGWTVKKESIGSLRHSNDPASYNGRFTLPADSTGDSFLVP